MKAQEDSSHKLIDNLKHDVEELQRRLLQPDSRSQELLLEMEGLKDSLHELNGTFQKALEEMKNDDLGKLLKTLSEKVETLAGQNETIAKGMVALADKLDGSTPPRMASPPPFAPPRMVQHTMGPPQMFAQPRMAPRSTEQLSPPPSLGEMSEPVMDLPPPPPGGKKGLF